jgi:hypothetical protein
MTNTQTDASAIGGVLRDIARGGLTGAIIGILGVGVGGRIVMRLAALLVPSSAGDFTENGNRIGAITFEGTLGLILVGMFFGLMASVLWVIVSPWLPRAGLRRVAAAAVIALALGTMGLIDGGNEDFHVLDFDPRVVGLLLLLVALIGVLFVGVDAWLDRHLPHATVGRHGVLAAYAVITGLGAVLVLAPTLGVFLAVDGPISVLASLAVIAVGLATLASWIERAQGHAAPRPKLVVGGRVALGAAVVLGSVAVLPEVILALGG